VRVTWFDTVHQQIKAASLPARVIKVTGVAATAPPPKPDAPTEPATEPRKSAPDFASVPNTATYPTINLWLAAAFVAALVGWAVTAWRLRRRAAAEGTRVDLRKPEADAYRAFCRACDAAEPKHIRNALDAWLSLRYAAPLADATRRFGGDADAHAAINALNARLYQRDAIAFDPTPLRRCVDAARKRLDESRKPDELPALYPSA